MTSITKYLSTDWRTILLQTLLLFVAMSTSAYFIGGHTFPGAFAGGLVVALIGVVANRFLSYIFPGNFTPNPEVDFELMNSEQLRISSPANYFSGGQALRGRLFLTDRRLIFTTPDDDQERPYLIVNHNDIEGMTGFNPFPWINNGVAIQARTGKIHKFVVSGQKRWLADMDRA